MEPFIDVPTQIRNLREELDRQIAQAVTDHPELTLEVIAQQYGVTYSWVLDITKKFRLPQRRRGRKPSSTTPAVV